MEGFELMERLRANVDARIELFATDDYWCVPQTERPVMVVINTGFRSGDGEHYVSFYVHSDSSVTYFDSFGFPPFTCLREFWKKHGLSPVRWSSRLLQSPLSPHCAHYQIVFGTLIDLGVPFKTFLSMFSDDVQTNDKAVLGFTDFLNK